MFSTAQLKFLPYVPDHTDLAPYHPQLARELAGYDVIHTTDAFFAFARTAESVSPASRHPAHHLVPHRHAQSYTRIFTRQTIEARFGSGWPARKLIDDWQVPERQGRRMDQRLVQHLRRCAFVAATTRRGQHDLAASILGRSRVGHLRLGIDKRMFGPHRADRAAIEAELGVPPGDILVLFVGRLDVGKNIHTLVDAIASLRAEGLPLQLITAGVGPAAAEIKAQAGRCGHRAPASSRPSDLARLYASVDLVALVSEVEIRSMVGVEAMASGCAGAGLQEERRRRAVRPHAGDAGGGRRRGRLGERPARRRRVPPNAGGDARRRARLRAPRARRLGARCSRKTCSRSGATRRTARSPRS